MKKNSAHKPTGTLSRLGATAAEIVATLRAKPAGAGNWMCLCPAHPDKTPSLSIRDRDGRVLLHCFAGCTEEAIVNAIIAKYPWLSKSALRATSLAGVGEIPREARPKIPDSGASENAGVAIGEIVARYDYTDADDTVLYQVVRYDPKAFRQRRPKLGGVGWTWNVRGVTPVLYRLPRVLKAKTVFVVEGEKDVEALEELGLTATTNSGGAGKWKPEFSAVLKGKQVIIIPDNDDPGRRHAEAVARSVHDAGAEWVKVVLLPGGAKDACDWVEAGGTKAQLTGIVKAAPEYQPPVSSKNEILSYEDVPLLADCMVAGPSIVYIEEPVLVAGAVTALTGDAGCGKSTLATAMAHRAHKAGRPVLVLDRENPRSVVADRFERLGVADGATFKIWGGWAGQEAPAPGDDLVLAWARACATGPVVLVDSMSAFHGGDENSASDTRAFLHQARRLADVGAAVVVVHHDGKAASARDYRGSSDFKAAVDIAFHVSGTADGGRLRRLTLRCYKSRFGFAGDVVYDYAGGLMEQRGPALAGEPAERTDARLMSLLRSNPGVTASAFVKLAAADCGRNRSRRFLSEGLKARTVRCERGPRNNEKRYWATDA